ncbi:hypothetical protein GGR56DRAFT_177205 [Xylariaceae sp. FL0804]|nr:hypothetical protein GGR56DRAFT_177205 [Xylariaceae sp. FL0804]
MLFFSFITVVVFLSPDVRSWHFSSALMDPLSFSASLIAVIELSCTVVQYISTASGATKERRRLRSEIQACNHFLQEIRDSADDADEPHTWSDTVKALEAPGAPLYRLSVTLRTIESRFKPKTGLKKAIGSLRWPLEEKEVNMLINSIECEKSVLQLSLANDSLRLLHRLNESFEESNQRLLTLVNAMENFSEVHAERLHGLQEAVGRLSTSHDREDAQMLRQAALSWLTRFDHAAQQNDIFNDRQPGTGLWLLGETNYLAWVDTRQQTLFCPGIPGAGKTILTSIVIDDLQQRSLRDPTIAVAYIYCNYKQTDEQQVEALISTLLKQLVEKCNTLPEPIRNIYERSRMPGQRITLDDLYEALSAIVSVFSKVYIVVDALDECRSENNCREMFLSTVFRLQREVKINFFATSRSLPEITEHFDDANQIEIRARAEDVHKYLGGNMSHLPRFVIRNDALQREIICSIIQAVDGIFLLAKLHLESLIGKISPKAVRKTLARLAQGSDGYDTVYRDIMERIRGQVDDQWKLAQQVLSWVTFSFRPLYVLELRHALAVEIGVSKFDPENLPDAGDLVSSCCGLITVAWPFILLVLGAAGRFCRALTRPSLLTRLTDV